MGEGYHHKATNPTTSLPRNWHPLRNITLSRRKPPSRFMLLVVLFMINVSFTFLLVRWGSLEINPASSHLTLWCVVITWTAIPYMDNKEQQQQECCLCNDYRPQRQVGRDQLSNLEGNPPDQEEGDRNTNQK